MGNPSQIPPQREPLFPHHIPAALKQGCYFVGWRWQQKNDRWTKPLFNVRYPQLLASSTDPRTWHSFDDAFDAYIRNSIHGIGRVLSPNDNFCGIDLDNCWDNQRKRITDSKAEEIVSSIPTYWEVSPSLTGLRGIGIVDPELKSLPGIKRGKYEIYFQSRYLTLTGRASAIYTWPLKNITDPIRAAYRLVENLNTRQQPASNTTYCKSNLSDDQILERIRRSKQSTKFESLYEGDWKSLNFPSQSEADFSLCAILSFWCGGDAEQVNRIFKQSKLHRPKWDDRPDYRQRTLARTCGHNNYGK